VSLNTEIDDILEPVLKSLSTEFAARLAKRSIVAYLSASAELMSWGRTKLSDKPIFFEGPPVQQAIDYARAHSARLVKGLDDVTRDRLKTVIADAINNKRGVEGLARDLRREFDDMSKARARSIAQTETNDALSQASLDRMGDMGVTGKEWVTAGDESVCPICGGNEAQGVIPVNEPFASGHMRPPGHPGECRCSLSPALLSKSS